MQRSKKIGQLNTSGDKFSLYVTSYGDHFDTQVIFFHDLGEYHDRYSEFANYLYKNKIGTTFIDMRGHGLSSGTRGHANSCQDLLEDYEVFFKENSELFETKDVFLCGHGLGALLCMSLDQYYNKLSGMILVNPIVQYRDFSEIGLHKYLGTKSLFDKFKIGIPTSSRFVTNERNLSSSMAHDPLINKKMTLGMYRSINELIKRVKYSSYFINIPVLYIIGEEDQVVDLSMSELFSSSIDTHLMMLKKYPSLGHELFNEMERDIVFKDICNWLALT